MFWRARRYLATAIAAVAASGCQKNGAPPMTILALDSSRVAAVSLEPKQQLSVYSIEQKRALWQVPLQPGIAALAAAFSRDGLVVAVFERNTNGYDGDLSVREAESGKQTSRPVRVERDRKSLNPPNLLAVASGGRFVASAIEGEGLRVDDMATGSVHRDALGLEEVGFSDDGSRLAATLRRNPDEFVVRVLTLDGGIRQVAEFERAWTHAWVGRKLALSQDSGVSLWDGAELRVLAPRTARSASKVRFVAHGKWLAVYEYGQTWQDSPSLRLAVYDVESERLVFEKVGLGAPLSVGMNATRLVGAFGRGDAWETFLVQLELPSGKVASEKNLGPRTRREHSAPFVYTGPGAPSEVGIFVPTVLPGARYLDVSDGEQKHVFEAIVP
jgi:hypothetical protein